MKKINVIADKEMHSFIEKFLEDRSVDFSVDTVESYSKRNDINDHIKENDLNLLKQGYFNAQVFQSSYQEVPTRLLVPKEFSSLKDWSKEYSMLHELGHFFSLKNNLIFDYYKYLEENNLRGELFNIPFEIEAEKYVFENNKKLFEKNANAVYFNYLRQIKDIIGKINSNSIRNYKDFYNIYEIRLFRYSSIIKFVCESEIELYKKHMENIKKIKKLLAMKGSFFVKINSGLDRIITSLSDDFYKGNFIQYINRCKEIYSILE